MHKVFLRPLTKCTFECNTLYHVYHSEQKQTRSPADSVGAYVYNDYTGYCIQQWWFGTDVGETIEVLTRTEIVKQKLVFSSHVEKENRNFAYSNRSFPSHSVLSKLEIC